MKPLCILVAGFIVLTATSADTEGGEAMTAVLKDVPTFHPDMDCGWMRFFGALSSVMRHQGEDVEYAYLMGVSGAAFRLKVHPDWCPSAQNPEMEYDIYPTQALVALGYTGDSQWGSELGSDKAMRMMRQHIDRGTPVIVSAAEIHPAPDFSSVVTGYGGDDRFLFFSYDHKRNGYDETTGDKLMGKIVLVSKTQPALGALDAVRQSFQLAIKMANTRELNGYAHGFAAYDAWIAPLEEREVEYSQMSQDELHEKWWQNAMIYEGLCDARGAAKRYLLRVQKELPADAAEKLRPVVEKYGQIQNMVYDNWKWFPFPHWVQKELGKTWTPLGMIEGTTWSREMRMKEIQVLRQVREAEEEAYRLMADFLRSTIRDSPTSPSS